MPKALLRIENPGLKRLLAREGQQFPRQLRSALDGAHDTARDRLQFRLFLQGTGQHVGTTHDHHQQIVELMRHAARELAHGLQPLCLPHLLLLLFAIGDIADRGRDQPVCARLDGGQADFHGKLAPILSQAVKFEAGAHGADLWCAIVALAKADVATPKSLWNQYLDWLAKHFCARISEAPFCFRIDQRDLPVTVYDHGGIGSRFQ